MNRVFIDMDGVSVDIQRFRDIHDIKHDDEIKCKKGAYLTMDVMPGAQEGIDHLIKLGLDVWFCTKPPRTAFHVYTEKAMWIHRNFPELTDKVIMTQDKSLIGGEDDYLIDDRPEVANAAEFPGNLLHYTGEAGSGWPEIIDYFDMLMAP